MENDVIIIIKKNINKDSCCGSCCGSSYNMPLKFGNLILFFCLLRKFSNKILANNERRNHVFANLYVLFNF